MACWFAALSLLEGAAPAVAADGSDWQFSGRYHATAFYVEGDEHGSARGWDNRRLRFGLARDLGPRLRLVADADFDGDPRFVSRLNTAFVRWQAAPAWTLTAGKLRRNVFTREDGIGSNVLDTVERALLTSVFFVRNYSGAAVTYKDAQWTASGSVFSAGERGDLGLPESGQGAGVIGNVARRVGAASELRLDLLYNGGELDARVLAPYRYVVSANAITRRGDWQLMGDLIAAGARQGGVGAARGVVLNAKRPLGPDLALVLRTEAAWSSELAGLRLPSRYASRLPVDGDSRGDRYRAAYLGLRYAPKPAWLGGSTLLLLTGLERGRLDTPDGSIDTTTAFLGLRWFFEGQR
ncbi:MAG: porin [Pseudomonadota bacterium]